MTRLIVNADDYGRSHSINAAVIRAHREGILTTASLMVNEPGCDEAVALARENPRMGVGLHLALVCGKSALPPEKIPDLVNAQGELSNNPAGVGFKYFFSARAKAQLRLEIEAQFERFRATGLKLDHVNGHLHMHLHPAVFSILMENAARWNIRTMRLTYDPFWLNARLAPARWLYRTSHAFIYRCLSARSRSALVKRDIRFTPHVFGLLQNALVDTGYIAKLLPQLPPGDSELYSHPSLDQFKNEFDALIDPANKALVQKLGIQLIRYQDL